MTRIFSIGHGARTLDEFVATLKGAGVRTVADVRTAPGSRKHPHFGRAALAAALAERGIEYVHLPELGGFRRPVAGSPNVGLRNESFRGYADHMRTEEFALGHERLSGLARTAPTAFLCSETLWWRCHRRLLADRLALDGWEVVHLLRPGSSEPHRPTPEARLVDGGVRYERDSADPILSADA